MSARAPITLDTFRALLKPVTDMIGGRPLDAALEAELNRAFPGDGDVFRAIESACHDAIASGWMCTQGGGGRKFGRIFEPADDLHRYSVDVVDITNLVGNHHRHPTGEIDMIMPEGAKARFDGRGRGWLVYPPDSAHRPTVTAGRALILYLLPEGRIEWTSS